MESEITGASAPTESTTESTASTSTSTSTESAAPSSPVEAPQATPGTQSPEGAQPPAVGAPGASQVPAAFTPNWKFKVGKEEHEIEEEYRAYVKNAEDEARMKRMHERAYGGKMTFKENLNLKDTVKGYENLVSTFNHHVNAGDPLKALQVLRLPEQAILQAAKQLLDLDSLPQQAKDIYTKSQQQEQAAAQLYQQNMEYQRELNTLKLQSRTAELNQVLATPEVKEIREKYDSVYGPGSFHQEVINEGQRTWAMQGVDPSAQDAVGAIVKRIKPFMSQPAPQQIAPKQVPVLPATGAGSKGSPAGGPVIQSIDDLKALAKTM